MSRQHNREPHNIISDIVRLVHLKLSAPAGMAEQRGSPAWAVREAPLTKKPERTDAVTHVIQATMGRLKWIHRRRRLGTTSRTIVTRIDTSTCDVCTVIAMQSTKQITMNSILLSRSAARTSRRPATTSKPLNKSGIIVLTYHESGVKSDITSTMARNRLCVAFGRNARMQSHTR